MVVGAKTVAAGVSAVGMVTLMSGLAVHFRSPRSVDNDVLATMGDKGGAVAGRVVSVPVKDYKLAFKSTLKLGQCPLVRKQNGEIQTCSDEFSGDEVLLAKGSMTVDVVRVETAEDIILHIMGGIGLSVGVLGLVSVSVKVNVAVTTTTNKKTLNLMNSYEMNKGVITLHNPKPKTEIKDSALYLSEIELGGMELLLVTMEFESEKQKIEVEITVTFKILFWSVSAKVKFVYETFKSKASLKIQFGSSFRKDETKIFNSLPLGLPELEKMEAHFTKGPGLLRDLSKDDENTHYHYYFASWKQSPYGAKYNLALINHDLDFLSEQNVEMLSVLHRINKLKERSWTSAQRNQFTKLNTTLTENSKKLTTGLDQYHKLTPSGRQELRDIYGVEKAPLYYSRELQKIVGE